MWQANKKILLVQKILLGSSQCYRWWRGSTKGEDTNVGREATTENVYSTTPKQKAVKIVWKCEIRVRRRQKGTRDCAMNTEKKWLCGSLVNGRVFWVENWSSRMLIFCRSSLMYIEHYSVEPAKKEKQCKVRVWRATAFERKQRRCGAQCRYGRTLWREAHKASTAAKFTI